MNKTYLTDLQYQINGAAIEIHKNLGPGLLESVYHNCLIYEFAQRKIQYISELNIPVTYKNIEINANLRCDFLIENSVILEIKAVDKVLPIHKAQLLTYIKIVEVPFGILINFNIHNIIKEGQQSFVNKLYRSLPDN